MSARTSTAHSSNRLGVALLIAALVCWIGFHLLPIDDYMRGWELWKRIWEITTRGYRPGWQNLIAISAFLAIAILVTASPFVTLPLRTSKPCRWLAIVASGAALLGLGSLIVMDFPGGPASALLLAAMALNFVGLICLRSPRLESGPDAP
ncbi:hypothetical protein OKA05_03465 [Luteolibacter arcticus]|uniref:Transmembrane protein n=1 Tax=Luteolibacter arcticus TaxID=1581411 RepID=A0ABT3GD89_9BACT|nr:hypothetical protein [Luteolibacter arcticus]MCW1921597.1 hypothetical protein [Luteolibacter arcticus]